MFKPYFIDLRQFIINNEFVANKFGALRGFLLAIFPHYSVQAAEAHPLYGLT